MTYPPEEPSLIWSLPGKLSKQERNMAKHQALGKGIGALLTSASQDGNRKYFLCPIEDLRPHHKQPRKSFNDNKLRELTDSIREKGIIQPLVVRRGEDHYQIIAGER